MCGAVELDDGWGMKAILVALIAGCASLALADEPAQSPPPIPKKRAVALGYAGTGVGVDVPRAGDSSLTPSGLGILGRIDLHKHWGLQFGYADKDTGLGTGGELTLGQAGVHWHYFWEGLDESLRLRFYTKAGVSWTNFKESDPSTGTFSDDAIGPSVGLGVEWGGPTLGAVFDVDWTFVDVELAAGQKESLTVGAGFIGLVYCF
jgi:opacity protein-like surface antigen